FVRADARNWGSGDIMRRICDLVVACREAMTIPSTQEVTEMLVAWSNGDESALERLIPLVHDELHRLAHRYMNREGPGHMLQTTALVNEAYLRLVDSSHVRWQNRAHFFAVSAQLMRRILVDFARSRNYLKRGGNAVQVSLDKVLAISPEQDPDVVALDKALTALTALDERKGRVI